MDSSYFTFYKGTIYKEPEEMVRQANTGRGRTQSGSTPKATTPKTKTPKRSEDSGKSPISLGRPKGSGKKNSTPVMVVPPSTARPMMCDVKLEKEDILEDDLAKPTSGAITVAGINYIPPAVAKDALQRRAVAKKRTSKPPVKRNLLPVPSLTPIPKKPRMDNEWVTQTSPLAFSAQIALAI